MQGQSAIMNITPANAKIFHLLQIFMMSKAMSLVNLEQGGQAFVRGIEQQGNISIKWLEESKPVSCLAHYQQVYRSRKNSAIYYSEWNSVSDSVTTRDVK
ncbi:FimD/PapC C-terminal domain-containing protein [Escherichia coli]